LNTDINKIKWPDTNTQPTFNELLGLTIQLKHLLDGLAPILLWWSFFLNGKIRPLEGKSRKAITSSAIHLEN